ncbi:hypothetical protein H0H92_009878 [Tricholoma furcatifolium]|nr:hypothetical protein H0H92_009878 [Tricholoma furcatifolium]
MWIIYCLKANSSVELQMYGLSRGGPHPYYLHGHPFYVVKGPYSNTYNWKNPVLRDTINTGLDGNLTVVRFFTDNSGPWFLHWGLAVIFAEDPEGTKAHVKPIPPAFDKLCPAYAAHNPDHEYQ